LLAYIATRVVQLVVTLLVIAALVFSMLRLIPDTLIDRASRTIEPDARRAMYEEIQEKIFAQVPWIFLHRLNGLSLVRADIENLNVLSGVEILLLADARRAN